MQFAFCSSLFHFPSVSLLLPIVYSIFQTYEAFNSREGLNILSIHKLGGLWILFWVVESGIWNLEIFGLRDGCTTCFERAAKGDGSCLFAQFRGLMRTEGFIVCNCFREIDNLKKKQNLGLHSIFLITPFAWSMWEGLSKSLMMCFSFILYWACWWNSKAFYTNPLSEVQSL